MESCCEKTCFSSGKKNPWSAFGRIHGFDSHVLNFPLSHAENPKTSLLRLDRADGASVFAGAAVDAGIGIDDVLRATGSDRVDGAGICACAAGDAFIGNYVSHFDNLQFDLVCVLYHNFLHA